MELSKYQTLPGKRSKKSELRAELNGDGDIDGEYFSPVQLSPVRGHDQDYSLSESHFEKIILPVILSLVYKIVSSAYRRIFLHNVCCFSCKVKCENIFLNSKLEVNIL